MFIYKIVRVFVKKGLVLIFKRGKGIYRPRVEETIIIIDNCIGITGLKEVITTSLAGI